MEEEEKKSRPYDVVMKVRPDGIPKPWNKEQVCRAAYAGRPHIRALTDHVWWGSRQNMQPSAALSRARFTWFQGTFGNKFKSALNRPIAIRQLLESMLSM